MKERKEQEDQGKGKKVKGKEQEGRGKAEKVQGETEAIQGKGRADRLALKRWLARVPPPDSDIWPQEYRGKRWKRAYALLFAGRCLLCQYSCQQPQSRRMLDKWAGLTTRLLCINHPACPGELREVLPTETCRNFKAKRWVRTQLPPAKPEDDLPSTSATLESDPEIRRIPVGMTCSPSSIPPTTRNSASIRGI
jgi:hypothetical protein